MGVWEAEPTRKKGSYILHVGVGWLRMIRLIMLVAQIIILMTRLIKKACKKHENRKHAQNAYAAVL